ncbi:hypothetical protein M0D69_03700 [Caballeronia sp. SEWSISQ10-4 2]|uniref:hypothetical protein n=1 Tax=Caballeronia sp. SEWSISQ10-4 2 TaxID=2937438 RepID=UPI002654B041|nr:hypothetical protein [Caballeronia sp. SEWSISQ10-4 2]MDN7177128.1 hypothetical protein [Caballeronia sp. SEWSISQ10-4 2]
MNQRMRAWTVIVGIKARALKKAEAAMTQCASNVAAAQQAIAQADAARGAAVAKAAEAAAGLAEAMRQPGGFSAATYLSHEASRAVLVQHVGSADANCAAALQHLHEQQAALDDARRASARAQTSLDACRDLRTKLQQALQQAADAEADDEAAETAAGRQLRARRKRAAEAALAVKAARTRTRGAAA